MLKDKDNLAYQAFPWSLVTINVICWLFVFGVFYLYILGVLRGFSLVLLPEGVSPFILLLLPVQGLILLTLVLRLRWVMLKGKPPSYIQILIALILTVTTSFSVFIVITHKKDSSTLMIDSVKAPYNVSSQAGIDLDSQKYSVTVPERQKQNDGDVKAVKTAKGDFYTALNKLFQPVGEISHKIIEDRLLFLLTFLIPSLIIAGFVNRYLLRKQYGDAINVSPLRISLIWLIALILTIPVAMFSEFLLALALLPGLGNILTISEIRRNLTLPISDSEQA